VKSTTTPLTELLLSNGLFFTTVPFATIAQFPDPIPNISVFLV